MTEHPPAGMATGRSPSRRKPSADLKYRSHSEYEVLFVVYVDAKMQLHLAVCLSSEDFQGLFFMMCH